MDFVTQQGLSQGHLLKEIQIHNPNNGKVEEEVILRASPSSSGSQAHRRTEDGDRHARSESRCAASPSSEVRRQLLAAVRQDDGPGVLRFVADGADVILMSEAMRLAAHRGSSAVVRELVAVGLSVNDPCPSTGFTPLTLAAVAGNMVVCELLLDALADVHRPVGGSTALMLARKVGNVEIQEVIERHVASMMMSDQGETEEAAHYRRAHVLPRVSPVLSEAVLHIMPMSTARLVDGLPEVAAQRLHLQGVGALPVDDYPAPPSPGGSLVDPQQILPL